MMKIHSRWTDCYIINNKGNDEEVVETKGGLESEKEQSDAGSVPSLEQDSDANDQ
jgi:hypothetical protein